MTFIDVPTNILIQMKINRIENNKIAMELLCHKYRRKWPNLYHVRFGKNDHLITYLLYLYLSK